MRRLIEGALPQPSALRLPYQPPLLLWSLAFIAGAALSLTDATSWILALAAAGLSLVALGSAFRSDAVRRHRRVSWVLLLLTPALIGVGYWRAEETRLPPDSLAHINLAGQPVRLEGTVVEEPLRRGSGLRVLLDAEQISIGAEQRDIDDRVQLYIPDPLEIAYGDRLAVEVQLTSTSAGAVEGDDDYLQWLANRRIAASGLAAPGRTEVLGRAELGWRQRIAADARDALNRSLRSALPPPISGVAQGMITGRRDAIDPELRADLNDTSLSHLIVISGSNLTLVTALVLASSAWLIGRRPAALLAIAAALAYGTLVGSDPPVQRAMWMAVVFAAAHLLGRGASALDAVTASAAIMVALEPNILLDIGFQLTLAGTLGIIMLMPALSQEFLSGQRGIVGALRDAAVVTLVATLATMPLIVLHFERAALVGLAANVLVTPVFSWMALGSAATAILGLASETLAATLGWVLAWLPLRWLVLVAEEAARMPGAGTAISGFGHIHLLTIYGAILIVALRPRHERAARWKRIDRDKPARRESPLARLRLRPIPDMGSHLRAVLIGGVASAVAAALWLSACSGTETRLSVHFLDVGQGDAALLVTPDSQTVLIDTGERSDAILAGLRAHMPGDVGRIDLVVITHPQADHGEGLWAVLEHYDAGQVLLSPHFGDTQFGHRLLSMLERRGIAVTEAEPGQQIAFAGEPELLLDVLWPPAHGLPDHYLQDPNATSIVIRARYGEAAFLFTGDINAEQELDLVRDPCGPSGSPCALHADVLKIAHHGSRHSSAALFLESVLPTLAILSAAADSPHGHPHAEVVAALERIGARAFFTGEHGDITVQTDGRSIQLTTEH